MNLKDLIVKCCVIFLFIAPVSRAQYQYDDQDVQNYSLADQTKSDMMIIVAAGLGGAVLGLSTLSFVDKPSDHYNNVLTGGAVGLIIGVLYVAYRQAYGPSGIFAVNEELMRPTQQNSKDFLENRQSKMGDLAFQWTWQF